MHPICNLGPQSFKETNQLLITEKSLPQLNKNYTTTEKELLAYVQKFKEYITMLTGAQIILYTDHKNLTFKTFSVQFILSWRLFLYQFDFQIKYIEGKKNVLTDCFSRLPRMEKPFVGDREAQGKGHLINFKEIKLPKENEEILNGEIFFQEAL